MENFLKTEADSFRNIILYGSNSATYKFALAKCLLEFANQGQETVSLENLAIPFSKHICDHLQEVDRQGTSPNSKFLDACRFYNAGHINIAELHTATEIYGFKNVIDAFHNVKDTSGSVDFFLDERNQTSKGIRITDSMFKLADTFQADNLYREVEARWKLVEEKWSQSSKGQQVTVLYEPEKEILIPALLGKRKTITDARPALNGYQKGHCFYCSTEISAAGKDVAKGSHVDHFLPHTLMSKGMAMDLDGVWNLVLACKDCNLSKSYKLPHKDLLPRLNTRNEFLIRSYHPLRETLIKVTGNSPFERSRFLSNAYTVASDFLQQNPTRGWRTPHRESPVL